MDSSIRQSLNYPEKFWEKNLKVLLKNLIICGENETNLLMILSFLFLKLKQKML